MKNNDTLIVPLEKQHEDSALSLVCDQFANGSVLHKAMNISAEEYRHHIQKSFSSVVDEALSLVALDSETNEIIGCLMATGFTLKKSDETELLPKFRPINALTENLEDIYSRSRKIAAGQFMLVDLAVVSDKARGRGVYSMLRNVVHDIGRQRQFNYVIGELSSAATQHFCVNKLGHSVKAEIAYADFEYEGSYPFKNIQTPPTIQLVEASLSAQQ